MSVNIILLTHENIGNALLATTKAMIGTLPSPIEVLSNDYSSDPDILLEQLNHFIDEHSNSDGFLILTDLYGSTPCNIACQLQEQTNIRIISGLNLPMLVRTINYSHLSLAELADKAITGGKDGVIDYDNRSQGTTQNVNHC